jgi:hypothetical protein
MRDMDTSGFTNLFAEPFLRYVVHQTFSTGHFRTSVLYVVL